MFKRIIKRFRFPLFFMAILAVSWPFLPHSVPHQPLKPLSRSVSSTDSAKLKSQIPQFDHIAIVMMENKTYSEIIGNKSAPYLNSLADSNALTYNYFAITHTSLPNYLALIGGDTFGITSDCTNCFLDKPNLTDNLDKAHKSWKGYMESMPQSCFVGDNPPYAQKHNPFIYFNDIRLNPDRCQKIVPLTSLETDLTNPLTTPNFIFISPNLCHDMHDCSVKVGDDWLSQQIPQILNSPTFKTTNSLLIITWDEAYGLNANQVATILVGPHVKQKFVSQTRYDHYSLLHTVESVWNLPSLTDNDKAADVMSDLFN
jgi:hypothetical protein